MSGYKPAGMHREKVLTAAAVRNLGPGFHSDGNGLFLKVDPSGARRWVQRIVVLGKRRDIGLGSAKLVTLVEAREKALQQRKVAREGEDPLAAKRRLQGIPTFGEAAKKFTPITKADGKTRSIRSSGCHRWKSTRFPTSEVCDSIRSIVAILH